MFSLCLPSVVAEPLVTPGPRQTVASGFKASGPAWPWRLRLPALRSGLLACGLSLVACSHAPLQPVPALPEPAAQDNRLVAEIAASLAGTPYRYGSDMPTRGFDCSGLVRYCYQLLGIELPRSVNEQLHMTEPVAFDALEIGDLVFFRLGSKVSHVGVYYGANEFVHAPSTGKAVMRSRLDEPYWRSRLVSAGRPRAAIYFSGATSPSNSSGVLTRDGKSAAGTGALSKNP
ncbi:MAG: C40 family peptidase [Immundisolibacter sp.]|uniref:C40 family peptidase n=1 Tax=Immundisolibacter sp. TaxID=1934948 RepID=UPI003EE067FF